MTSIYDLKFGTNHSEYESESKNKFNIDELDDLDDLFGTIKASGKDIDDDRIAMIKNFYNKTLSTNRTDISHEDINKLLGSHLDTRDDYYAGRMTEPFKETVRYKDRNKAIDDANNNG